MQYVFVRKNNIEFEFEYHQFTGYSFLIKHIQQNLLLFLNEDHVLMYFSQSATGLDFERYLLPSLRDSVSPEQSLAADRFSLGVMDAEMESPVSQPDESHVDVLASPTGTCCP